MYNNLYYYAINYEFKEELIDSENHLYNSGYFNNVYEV